MTIESSFAEQEQLAATRRMAASRMTLRARTVEVLVAIGLVAAVVVLWWLRPPHRLPLDAIWPLAVMVLATRVQFDTPFGFTVASQLAFVPLLFALAPALVPLAVVVTVCASGLPELLRGEVTPGGLLRTPANAWFAVGPALVFVIAGVAPRHAGPLLLIAALGAQFAVDFAASAVRFCVGHGASLRSQLVDSWAYGVDAALSGVGLVVAEEVHRSPYAVLAVVPLLGLLAMFARERRGRLDNLLELNDTYRGTALLLGDVIAADDDYTGEHSQGVVGLAVAVGARLGLDAERRRNLEFGALLHDVGKIAIPKEVINKPGKLSPDEWELIKTHTIEGQRMLGRVGGFMIEVGGIVRSHHERWDGGGYPDGLAGTAIPLEARIITGCDSWNAMRTDRPYRRALAYDDAVAEILTGSGGQFDPEVALAILQVVNSGSPPALGAGVRSAAPLEAAVVPVADQEAVVGAVEAQGAVGGDVAGDAAPAPHGSRRELGHVV